MRNEADRELHSVTADPELLSVSIASPPIYLFTTPPELLRLTSAPAILIHNNGPPFATEETPLLPRARTLRPDGRVIGEPLIPIYSGRMMRGISQVFARSGSLSLLSTEQLREQARLKALQVAAEEDHTWELRDPQQACWELYVSSHKGLSTKEATARLNSTGQFKDVVVVILLVGAIISMSLGEFPAGIAILVIVTFNAFLGVKMELSATAAIFDLKNSNPPICEVVRDGQVKEIPTSHLVPGDIVVLSLGRKVPADMRLIKSSGLQVNEMPLTGESIPAKKDALWHKTTEAEEKAKAQATLDGQRETKNERERKNEKEKDLNPRNLVFMGCMVEFGNGKGVVFHTGMKTRMGSIQRQLSLADDDVSPLAKKLTKLGTVLGIASMLISVVVLLLMRLVLHNSWIHALLVAVSLTVAAVPEGLPVCVTIALAVGMRTMALKHRAQILRLKSVETLGTWNKIFAENSLVLRTDNIRRGHAYHGAQTSRADTTTQIGGNTRYMDTIFAENSLVLRTDNIRRGHAYHGFKHRAQILRLKSVETLGSASVICTDKTGTLTKGEMTAVGVWMSGRQFRFTGSGYDPSGYMIPEEEKDAAMEEESVISQIGSKLTNSVYLLPVVQAALCSNAMLQYNDAERIWEASGNISERPLVVAARKAGFSNAELKRKFPKIKENPFSSIRKMMSTLHKIPIHSAEAKLYDGAVYLAIVKGAPNVILKACSKIVSLKGEMRMTDGIALPVSPLNDSDREMVFQQIDSYSDQAYRVLAVAYKTYREAPAVDDEAELESNLTLIGLIASIDPERPEVKPAIQAARVAGIRTVMITGDYVKTAKAIAENVGILPRKASTEKAVDCAIIRDLGIREAQLLERERDSKGLGGDGLQGVWKELVEIQDQLDSITAYVDVYARARPEDKITIVRSLQRQGNICSMTGDGVNDAPALKQANIGVAMGITGTDVAKGAADMILLDDNFVAIIAAIRQGRIIYANIQKFCYFLLSTNVAEVLFIVIAVSLGLQSPLVPLQQRLPKAKAQKQERHP
eukprot:g73545.t1